MSVVANAVDAPSSTRKNLLQGGSSALNSQAKALVGLIHNKPLPIFKQTLKQLSKFNDEPSSSIPKMVECLRLDPGYSYQIFCTANSGLFSHKRKPATTLQHAVLVLGIPQVITIGKSLPFISELDKPRTKSLIYQLMCRMYHAGVQARELVADLDQNAQDSAFIAAQMRDAYLISLWLYAPDKIEKLLKAESQQIVYAPNGILNEVGRIITKQDNCPISIQQSFTPQPKSNRLVKTIAFANHISQLTEVSWYSTTMKDLIAQSSIALGLSESALSQQAHQSALIAARESNFYPIKPAACRLVELEQPIVNPKVKKPKRMVEPRKIQSSPASTENPINPQLGSDLKIALRQLAALSQGKHSPQEILEFGFKLLQENMKKNSVAFFLLDKNKTLLKSRFTTNFENEKQPITLQLKSKSIFKALMKKQQSILITENNRGRFSSLLTAEFSLPIHEKDFAAISVFIQKKPIGLFYLQNKTLQSISTDDCHQFITICQATTSSLEEVKKNA